METERAGKPKKRVEELRHASRLVGRIVEKGFSRSSASTKPPQPSVLPFPVARHRSHGPRWAPAAVQVDADEEEAEEDKAEADYDPVASFANPIERKPKKGLDFSRWRELGPGNSAAAPRQPKKKASKTTTRGVDNKKISPAAENIGLGNETITTTTTTTTEESSSMEVDSMIEPNPANSIESKEEVMALEEVKKVHLPTKELLDGSLKMEVGRREEHKPVHEMESEVLEYNGQKMLSLMDDISAENLTCLQRMSLGEIAEAQAEIMEKMNPSIVEMLKKRGQGKLGNKKGGGSDRDKGQPVSESEKPVERGKSSAVAATLGDWVSSGVQSSSLWKAWSERVEKVRDLRFSLEGDVMEIDFTQEQAIGKKPECRQYNVENVAERDFLRTEGNPASLGYTIIEAVFLIQSMMPGQRALGLQLLATILSKALHNLQKKDFDHKTEKTSPICKYVDWQAIWAFALGPEPKMALSLRMALDDKHDFVVLSCVKAIQCILSCELNESLFNITEKLPMHEKTICTAPVFRSRPDSDGGFLQGGFWKYSAKPSNILPLADENEDEENEGKHSIQDDVVVAGQDVAAGLIRMGILPRIVYLLEMDPLPTLEESLVSILIALARHSPTSANAIMRCPRLVETVAKMFTKQGSVEIHPCQIKAIVLLKVLSQSSRQTCLDFVRRGTFQEAMWHWYRPAFPLDHWIKRGRERCKLTSALMVEQLRFWKVCIKYGYCITHFADFFPAMCLWLSPPMFGSLIEKNVFNEFTSVSTEAYLVLEALAQRLPSLHSVEQLSRHCRNLPDRDMEAWSWAHAVPIVEIAINWLSLKDVPYVSSLIGGNKDSMKHCQDISLCGIMWAISAVLHMLGTIFETIAPGNVDVGSKGSTCLPWLPQFVPMVGLRIVKNGFLNFLGTSDMHVLSSDGGSLVQGLCHLRRKNDPDISLASVSLLHGLVRLIFSVDRSVRRARSASCSQPPEGYRSGIADKILEEGIVKWAESDLIKVLNYFTTFVPAEWHLLQSAEIFGRGGPAPGVGVGWGSSGGGFWSPTTLLAQLDAQLILKLLENIPAVVEKDLVLVEGMKPASCLLEGAMTLTSQRINSVLGVCLIAGPGDKAILEKALDTLLQAPVLKYLNYCVHHFQSIKGFKFYDWHHKEEDHLFFSDILKSHFKSRWLSIKKKSSDKIDINHQCHDVSGKSNALETIQEDLETSDVAANSPDCSSLLIEWAHQRLPLPVHWPLSAVSIIGDLKNMSLSSPPDVLNVAKSGLFLLLGLEAMSLFLGLDLHDNIILSVPVVWKLHVLSVALHANMDVLEEQKTRDIFETLQDLYGQQLDWSRLKFLQAPSRINEKPRPSASLPEAHGDGTLHLLNFRTQIHESYTTFVENLIEQFGAISYGDMIYGRQVALYLHRSVDAMVRLAAWNALANAHILELLPALEKCVGEADGYLEPVEENEGILEAYVKSWIYGGLDRAATRRSVSFALALHHLSCFIFKASTSDKVALRNRLAKSLLRSYSQKQHHERMLLDFVRYRLPMPLESLQRAELDRRFELLKEACEGNSSLLLHVEGLRASVYEVNHQR